MTVRLTEANPSSQSGGKKYYEIKPTKNRSPEEKQLNTLYKQAASNPQIILFDDQENEFRIEVTYEIDKIIIDVNNLAKGHTNYIYAARINEATEQQKVS